jgi:hypothetical protein
VTALFCPPSRMREGAGGWALGIPDRNGWGKRVPTPNPTRQREGRK